MRVLMTSFAALLVLVAFGPGVTGAAPGDDNGAAGGAQASAIPPVPAPVPVPTTDPAPPPAPVPTLAPVPPPVAASTLAPAPVLSPTPAGQVRDQVNNPGTTQMPGAVVNSGVAANQRGDQWRYRQHNGTWWYWTPDNRWIYHNGNQWLNYEPALTAVPDARYSSQPAYGYYQPSPNGYYQGPYRYSTGYGGYYGPAYQGGYYYGPGGYYGQPGVSVRWGIGRGFRFGF